MAYSSGSDVAALCPSLVDGGSNFTTSTRPTLVQINSWLSSGCADIELRFQAAGYATPVTVAAAPEIHTRLRDLNTLYAASFAELSRLVTRISTQERTRGQFFWKMYNDGMDELLATDLASAGLSPAATAPIYIGGISVDDKDTREDDSDRVEPRFKRGQFDFPNVLMPQGTSGS